MKRKVAAVRREPSTRTCIEQRPVRAGAFSRVLPPRGLCTPLRQKTSKFFHSSFPTVFFRMEHIIERIYIDSCRMSRRTSIIIERNRGFCHVDDSMTNYRGVFGL